MPKGQKPWNKGTKGVTGRKPTGRNLTCHYCHGSFYRCAAAMKKAVPKYCTAKCYFGYRWGDRKEVRSCVICSKEFTERRATERICCGKRCRRLRMAQIHSGELSRFWRGGKMAPYVGEWKFQRALTRERDGYKCVLCGSEDRIQVHHKNPYRYSKSHALSNLQTLCRSCHSKEEYKANPICKTRLDEARGKRKCHTGKSSLSALISCLALAQFLTLCA